ncbi:MAG TPA: hypothetical protein VGV61_00905 [Thermoanaerobaculia bacterium]|jgi:hypothetical protein|nr:hypothetical protein [Thermoanaerobaculia bacterium]
MRCSSSPPFSWLVAAVLLAAPAVAEDQAKGTLVVGDESIAITHVYAHAEKGFFDPKTLDVVVLLCDAAVPAAGVRDDFARRELVKAGKLHCVQQTIDAGGQVISYRVEHRRFGMTPSGGSSYQVFEAQSRDARTIAGRARTTATQKSFDDVPYSYDITFSAAIEPPK